MPDIAGSYINIDRSNITTNKSKVRQLIDIVQTDIASVEQSTRKSYEVFVSGVNSQNITSSLFQTVFDQEFALGTANPLFDVSIGSLLEEDGTNLTVNTLSSGLSRDAGGKVIGFADSTPMMREKINVYRQFAQNLLGDADSSFFLPHSATAEDVLTSENALTRKKKIRGAIFICFRRLFTRDNIHKGSFGLKLHKNAGKTFSDFLNGRSATLNLATGTKITNIDAEITSQMITDESNSFVIIDDALSATNLTVSPVSGEVSTLKNASGHHVGNIYYDSGIIVLDVERVFDADQLIRGIINSVSSTNVSLDDKFVAYGKINDSGTDPLYFYPVYTSSGSGRTLLGGSGSTVTLYTQDSVGQDVQGTALDLYIDDSVSQTSGTSGTATRPNVNYPLYIEGASGSSTYYSSLTTNVNGNQVIVSGSTLHNGSLYPSLWTSGTIDEVLDHICTTRFGRGNASSMTFKNETFINSSFIFCRAAPTQLNYSTNPTYTDDDGDIVAIDNDTNNTFAYVTTIGLYDAKGDLLAVAKTSRPIEKNPETDLSVRIRLDY